MKKRRGLAKKNDIFLEVTTRASHNLTNGHMSRVAKTSNAKLLINTDTNSPNDLINKKFALKTVVSTGLNEDMAKTVVYEMAGELAGRIS